MILSQSTSSQTWLPTYDPYENNILISLTDMSKIMRGNPQRFGEIFSDHIRQQTYISETTFKKKTLKAEMTTIFKLVKSLLKYALPNQTASRDVQHCKSLRKCLVEPEGDVAKRAKRTDPIMCWQECGATGMLPS